MNDWNTTRFGGQEAPEPALIPSLPLPVLPNWLADEESLRDEGVLFGLSDADPDTKVAQIHAFFASQVNQFSELIGQYTGQVYAFTVLTDQRENRINSLRDELEQLRASEPVRTHLIRHLVSLILSVVLCIGTFFLIDETLRPAFPNRWVAVGVFLAGLFNLFGRTSFFYETGTRLTGRRLIGEVGLPLAAAVFVLVHALPSHPLSQALGLFTFIFFVFLLSGKLVLSTLSILPDAFDNVQKNQRLVVAKRRNLPLLESRITQFEQEVDGIRIQKRPFLTALNQAESNVTRLNTQRDKLVNLFLSEFELARSLRDRLTKQQRNLIMND